MPENVVNSGPSQGVYGLGNCGIRTVKAWSITLWLCRLLSRIPGTRNKYMSPEYSGLHRKSLGQPCFCLVLLQDNYLPCNARSSGVFLCFVSLDVQSEGGHDISTSIITITQIYVACRMLYTTHDMTFYQECFDSANVAFYISYFCWSRMWYFLVKDFIENKEGQELRPKYVHQVSDHFSFYFTMNFFNLGLQIVGQPYVFYQPCNIVPRMLSSSD